MKILRRLAGFGAGCAVLLLAGCSLNIDAPQTPTVVLSPTRDETAVARLATATPTRTPTPSATPSPSVTATASITASVAASPTPSETPTASATASLTPSATPSLTATASPTLRPSATPAPTATPSPTATASPTLRPSSTPAPTATVTLTVTPVPTLRPSATASLTPSATPSLTVTASPTLRASATPAPTVTLTITPVPTLRPSATLAPTLTLTPTPPSATPTAPIAVLEVPSATRAPTLTFTPYPTLTPSATLPATPVPTLTPTLTPALLPPTSALPVGDGTFVQGTPIASAGNGTFYDPNAAPANPPALPVAPVGPAGPAGPPLPEQASVVVSYQGQVVPLLNLNAPGSSSTTYGAGTTFAISSQGVPAVVDADRWLIINGQRMIASPSSQYGLDPVLSVTDLVWSPDGQRLALRVDAANPEHDKAIDAGVWIYEPGTNSSWQIFRTGFAGHVAQLHEQRRPVGMRWSPNGQMLVIKVDIPAPLGPANVVLPVTHNANEWIDSIPFADANWTLDSSALIVSGVWWQTGQTVVGRVGLDGSYTEILNQAVTGLATQAAADLPDGRIAFLGTDAAGNFALYVVSPAPGSPIVILSAPIAGQVIAAEWNATRTALLVTAQTAGGVRLWILRTDGSAQDVTPFNGPPDSAHWR